MTIRPPHPLFIRLILSLWLALMGAGSAWAKNGQTYYEEGRFEEALEQFIAEQVERPDDAKVMINLGTTLYRLKRYKEAAAAFERAAQTEDPALKQHALYDLGNSQFREQAFEEAVKSYEQAVSADPNDVDARENLAVAKAALAQQPQDKDPQNQDPNKKQSDDPNRKKDESSSAPQDSSENEKKENPSPSADAQEKQKEERKNKEPDSKAQDQNSASGEDKETQKEAASQSDDGAKADRDAPTTMSRARAEQLLDKLGETKTVRPQAQKARAPAGGKTW